MDPTGDARRRRRGGRQPLRLLDSVSDSGDTAVIGAVGDDGFTGAAYVFTRADDAWAQQAELTADDPAANDFFGWSVAVSDPGDAVVVGESSDDEASFNSGSAYLFER